MKKKVLNILIGGMPQSGSTVLFNIINFILTNKHNSKYFNITSLLYHPTHDMIPWEFMYTDGDNKKIANNEFLTWYDEYRDKLETNITQTVLLKEHHYSDAFLINEWADVIFLIKRDIRDSIASRRRRGKPLMSKGKLYSGMEENDSDNFDGFKKWCEYLVKDCWEDWILAANTYSKNLYLFEYSDLKNNFNQFCSDLFTILKNNVPVSIKHDQESLCQAVNDMGKSTSSSMFFSLDKITNKDNTKSYKDSLSKEEIEYVTQTYEKYI